MVRDLVESHEMALPSFMEHLHTPEAAGLIASEKKGRLDPFDDDITKLMPQQDK